MIDLNRFLHKFQNQQTKKFKINPLSRQPSHLLIQLVQYQNNQIKHIFTETTLCSQRTEKKNTKHKQPVTTNNYGPYKHHITHTHIHTDAERRHTDTRNIRILLQYRFLRNVTHIIISKYTAFVRVSFVARIVSAVAFASVIGLSTSFRSHQTAVSLSLSPTLSLSRRRLSRSRFRFEHHETSTTPQFLCMNKNIII